MNNSAWPFPTSVSLELNTPDVGDDTANPELNALASANGVRFLHIMKGTYPCTVAYRPIAPERKKSTMLEVSVAYKHPNDNFTKQIGATVSAKRLLRGECLVMPLRGESNQETIFNLYSTFMN